MERLFTHGGRTSIEAHGLCPHGVLAARWPRCQCIRPAKRAGKPARTILFHFPQNLSHQDPRGQDRPPVRGFLGHGVRELPRQPLLPDGNLPRPSGFRQDPGRILQHTAPERRRPRQENRGIPAPQRARQLFQPRHLRHICPRRVHDGVSPILPAGHQYFRNRHLQRQQPPAGPPCRDIGTPVPTQPHLETAGHGQPQFRTILR